MSYVRLFAMRRILTIALNSFLLVWRHRTEFIGFLELRSILTWGLSWGVFLMRMIIALRATTRRYLRRQTYSRRITLVGSSRASSPSRENPTAWNLIIAPWTSLRSKEPTISPVMRIYPRKGIFWRIKFGLTCLEAIRIFWRIKFGLTCLEAIRGWLECLTSDCILRLMITLRTTTFKQSILLLLREGFSLRSIIAWGYSIIRWLLDCLKFPFCGAATWSHFKFLCSAILFRFNVIQC